MSNVIESAGACACMYACVRKRAYLSNIWCQSCETKINQVKMKNSFPALFNVFFCVRVWACLSKCKVWLVKRWGQLVNRGVGVFPLGDSNTSYRYHHKQSKRVFLTLLFNVSSFVQIPCCNALRKRETQTIGWLSQPRSDKETVTIFSLWKIVPVGIIG